MSFGSCIRIRNSGLSSYRRRLLLLSKRSIPTTRPTQQMQLREPSGDLTGRCSLVRRLRLELVDLRKRRRGLNMQRTGRPERRGHRVKACAWAACAHTFEVTEPLSSSTFAPALSMACESLSCSSIFAVIPAVRAHIQATTRRPSNNVASGLQQSPGLDWACVRHATGERGQGAP